jgi:hypothetical protein
MLPIIMHFPVKGGNHATNEAILVVVERGGGTRPQEVGLYHSQPGGGGGGGTTQLPVSEERIYCLLLYH